jgi:hypothetical protein
MGNWMLAGIITGAMAADARAASLLVNFDSVASGAAANDAVAGSSLRFDLAAYLPELDSQGDPIPGSEAYRPDPEPFDLVRVDDPSQPPGAQGYGNAPSPSNALDAIDQGVLVSFDSPLDLDAFSITLDLSTLGFPGDLDIVFQGANGQVLALLPTRQSIPGFVASLSAPLSDVGSIFLPGGAYYDDLRISTAPEPLGLWLIGGSLAGLLARRRPR